jgi:4-amino-4-deoxy-L-arabinose transferase-like glycosyltransferase
VVSDRLWQIGLFAIVVSLYTVLAFVIHSDVPVWDEWRYIGTAKNLLMGFFVTGDDPNIIGGPGYPLLLVPFIAGDVSLLWARVLNAWLVGLAALMIFSVIRHYAGRWWALAGAALTVFHPNLARMTPFLMTEALAMFCVALFLWCFSKALRCEGRATGWLVLAAVAMTWLTFTRLIFGHVMTATLVLAAIAALVWRRHRVALLKTVATAALSLLLCVPYLLHTYSLTGKFPYWSTNGSELLYWLTSHHPGENGHWYSDDDAMRRPELAPNHKTFYEGLWKMHIFERESALMEAAKENIRSDPKAVFHNWLCNISRLFFGFPRSFQKEELITVLILAFNGPLVLLCLAALVLWGKRPHSMPAEVVILAGIAVIYLGGTTLASALPRYLLPILPMLWLAIAILFRRNVTMKLT